MLKTHNNNNNNNLTAGDLSQRRPSRIGASTTCSQQQQQPGKFCSSAPANANGSSRLKSSCIAKVPLANSRLREPVAAELAAKKSTKPISTVAGPGRPTSLPLGCGSTRTLTARSSLLPTSKSSAASSANRVGKTTIRTQLNGSASVSRRVAQTATTTTTTKQQGKFLHRPDQPRSSCLSCRRN